MTDGSYLLLGYPQGEPAAFVGKDDAGPLRVALTAAFGSPTDTAVSGNGNGNNTGKVLHGHDALRTKQVRP